MGKIHQSANFVIVWLGEEEEFTPIAFRYLRYLSLRESAQNKEIAVLQRMVYKLWAKVASKKGSGIQLQNQVMRLTYIIR